MTDKQDKDTCSKCVFELDILGQKEAINYLKEKDALQNGSIQRIEKKVDEMHTFLRRGQWAIILLLLGVILDILVGNKVSKTVALAAIEQVKTLISILI